MDREQRIADVLAGWLMMLAGAYMVLAAIFRLSPLSTVVVACVFALYPVLHSFLLYRRIEGFGPDPDEEVEP